ncbi:uncharacterized protein LOC144153983 [Haemaphysalis longicornis]
MAVLGVLMSLRSLGAQGTQGRLEGLELGVPAACFRQRFCAWGTPCADVSDRARLSIVGVRLGLRYAKALHARLGAWSPHQQPPGMLQRCLPAGPLSAFSTLSRRRIDVAFTWLQRAGLVRQVRTPLGSSKPEARPSLPVFCTSLQSFTPPKHDVVASRHVAHTPCFNCENKRVF